MWLYWVNLHAFYWFTINLTVSNSKFTDFLTVRYWILDCSIRTILLHDTIRFTVSDCLVLCVLLCVTEEWYCMLLNMKYVTVYAECICKLLLCTCTMVIPLYTVTVGMLIIFTVKRKRKVLVTCLCYSECGPIADPLCWTPHFHVHPPPSQLTVKNTTPPPSRPRPVPMETEWEEAAGGGAAAGLGDHGAGGAHFCFY